MDKIKIVFRHEKLEILGIIDNVVDNEEDLRKFQKTCKRAVGDLCAEEIERAMNVNKKTNDTNLNLATAKQKAYLLKLGIQFEPNITKEEATALLDDYYNKK